MLTVLVSDDLCCVNEL